MKQEITLADIRDEYPFTSHWFRVGNFRMHYLDEGSGPVILLLHACPMWSFAFRRVIRDLSSQYRLIAPDCIGFGLSDKPLDYDYHMDNQVACIEKLLNTLKIDKFSIVMHGWGATIGSNYIIRHPDQIENVVVMNSMAFTGYRLPFRLRLYRFWPWFVEHFLIDMNLMFSGNKLLSKKVRNGYRLPFQKRRDKIAILRFISQMPSVPEDEAYESMIEVEYGLWLIREHPMCLIWAEKDWLYPLKYLANWMKICPEAHVFRIRNAGRYVMEEAYDEYFAVLSGFLRSHKK